MSHALAPLFTIHRALKSFKSVWQREDMSKFKRKCMLANLSIYLATFYSLTRYNKALFNEVGDPEMKNTLLIVLIFTLMLFADAISLSITNLIFGG